MIKIIKRLLKNIFGIHSPTEEWTKIPVEYNEKDTMNAKELIKND